MEIFLDLFRSQTSLASILIRFVIYSASALLFINGLWASYKAFRWLRRPGEAEIDRLYEAPLSSEDPLLLIVMKTYRATGKESQHPWSHPSFIADATRQMAESLFEGRFLESITMSSNLLPPLGFIGTVFGMILIFLVNVDPNSALNTVGLGTALFTTLVALFLFVILEIIKMWLTRLFKLRIETGLLFAMEREL